MFKARMTLIASAVVFALCLSSCAKKPAIDQPVQVCSKSGEQWLQRQVERAGGQYVEYGQQVLFEVPTREVFIGESRNYKAFGRKLISLVAKRVSCYTTRSVIVTVFAGALPSPRANIVLSRQRAQRVGQILRDKGVERLISERGELTNEPSTACGINRVQIKTKQFGSTYIAPPVVSCAK